MIAKQWRERLAYTLMSAVVLWHTLALVVAPAPDSKIVQSLRRLLHPYLTLLRLDNPWDFYAPNIGTGHLLQYVIEDAAGRQHTFVPVEELSSYHPRFWWFRAWYDAVLEDPEKHGGSIAALLCRRHVALHPIAVTLRKIQQGDFSRADHLSGKHPLDPEFVTESTLKRLACPQQ